MLAKIWNYNGWCDVTSPDLLSDFCDHAIALAGFTVLKTVEHHFEPQGYTKLWLLCESHFAVHTFPEHGKTYFELSSCNREYYERLVETIKAAWKVMKE